jgi:hypothetical protein
LTVRAEISAASTGEQQATVAEAAVATASVIAAEARLESVLQVAVELVRMIDPAVREIALVEAEGNGWAIAAWEAVLRIGAPLEIPDTAAATRAQAAVEALQALTVRVGAMAEPAVEVSVAVVAVVVAAVAVVVAVVAAGGGSEGMALASKIRS